MCLWPTHVLYRDASLMLPLIRYNIRKVYKPSEHRNNKKNKMAIHIINPNEKYESNRASRDSFVKTMDHLGKLGEYIQALGKDGEDPSLRSDLGGLLHDNPGQFVNQPAGVPRSEAGEAYSELIQKLGGWVEQPRGSTVLVRNKGYVENNLDAILDHLGADELFGVVNGIPLYTSGEKGDEGTDKKIALINEVQKVSRIGKSQDPGDITAFVNEKMKEMPKWMQRSYASYTSGSDSYVQALFSSFVQNARLKMEHEFIGKDGKFDKAKVRDVFDVSLKVANREYNAEPSLKDQKEIFEKGISHYYLVLAQIAHQKKKGEEKTQEELDRDARKKARRKLGIAA